ncbi:MAG: hypothetical protein NTW21_36480 [Verrucomicrobia bacterium]|nr:hypothetical protein [Verrucomicrobiota bacterium]
MTNGSAPSNAASGWERDIADPLLREDIAVCVDKDPTRRLPSAADLAERLLSLDPRRAKIAEQKHLARAEAARAEAEVAAIGKRDSVETQQTKAAYQKERQDAMGTGD